MEWRRLLRISSKEVESQDATLVRAAATELVKGIALLSQDERRKMWLVRSGAAALANEEGVDIFKIEMETETGTAEDAARASKSNGNDNDERADMVRGSAYFRKLIGLGYDGNSLESTVTKQIEKDVHRSGLGTDEQPLLKRTLFAYAVRNRDVGYVQGMNFIVARCARESFSEEQCFWMLAAIVERVLPVLRPTALRCARRQLGSVTPARKTQSFLEGSSRETRCRDAGTDCVDVDDIRKQCRIRRRRRRLGFHLSLLIRTIRLCANHDFLRVLRVSSPESSGSAESFDVEMIMMDALQRWRKMSGSATRQIPFRALEWTIERFPDADAIRSMRASARRYGDDRAPPKESTPCLAACASRDTAHRDEVDTHQADTTASIFVRHGPSGAKSDACFVGLDRRFHYAHVSGSQASKRSIDAPIPESTGAISTCQLRISIEAFFVRIRASCRRCSGRQHCSLGPPTELKAAMPKLVDNLSDLASKLYDASERAEPARQLVASILKVSKRQIQRISNERSHCVTCGKRWLQETDLWSCIPGRTKELQRSSCPSPCCCRITYAPMIRKRSVFESALVRAAWLKIVRKRQAFCSHPHRRLHLLYAFNGKYCCASSTCQSHSLGRKERPVPKERVDLFDQLLRILLREHEKKMATANFVHSALKCLERVKRLLKEDGSFLAGIAADIELAKHYA